MTTAGVAVAQDEARCRRLLQFMATHVKCGDGRQTRSLAPACPERHVRIEVRCLGCGARFVEQIGLPALAHALRADGLPRLAEALAVAAMTLVGRGTSV